MLIHSWTLETISIKYCPPDLCYLRCYRQWNFVYQFLRSLSRLLALSLETTQKVLLCLEVICSLTWATLACQLDLGNNGTRHCSVHYVKPQSLGSGMRLSETTTPPLLALSNRLWLYLHIPALNISSRMLDNVRSAGKSWPSCCCCS